MAVLAIDPGNEETALVLWDGTVMLTKVYIPNREVKTYLNHYNILSHVEVVIIEMVSSYGAAVGQTIFDTCVWIGIFKEYLENLNLPVHLVFRKTLKMHHCHSLRGINDGAVNSVLRDKYGEDNTIKKPNLVYWNDTVESLGGRKWMNGDLWAAFALATWYYEPKDSPVENSKEKEKNKLSKSIYNESPLFET